MGAPAKHRAYDIRPFAVGDREQIRDLCHRVGYMGGPADWYWRHRQSFAEIWTSYYTDYPDRGNFIAFIADPGSRELLRRLVRSFRSVATIPSEGAALPAILPGVAWSDHRSFWDAGIAAVMVTDTAPFRDPAYHLETDTPERLDYERLARVVEGLAHAVGDLATSEP